MKILFIIFLFLSISSSWAFSGREAWIHSNMPSRVYLLNEYKAFFQELAVNEELGELSMNQNIPDFFFSSAWASEGMNCIYAGWPSKRVNNVCSSPVRHNPDYQKASCKEGELQCQPLLFGKGLCVPVKTRSQRSLAFTNCEKKKKTSTDALIREIRADGNQQVLFELMDFADKICTSEKQAGTGMCKRLKAAVERLRHFKEAAVLNVTVGEKVKTRSPAVTSKPHVKDFDQLGQSIEEELELIKTVTTANKAIESVNPDDCVPEEAGDPFDRDEPRDLNFDYTFMKAGKDPAWDDVFMKDKGGDIRENGFEFRNIGPNKIAGPAIDPNEKSQRTWTFTTEDNSRRETYLWITDNPGSGYLSDEMQTIITFIPRKMKPKIEASGDELHVTLTTGEKVILDKATKTVKGGIIKEGPMDMNRNKHQRKFADLSYTGTGISIRVDKRAEDPRISGGKAKIIQNGKSCEIPATDLWKSNSDFKYADDKNLIIFLNQKCGNKFSL